MNTLTSLYVAAVLVTAVWAEEPNSGDARSPQGGPGYGGAPHGGGPSYGGPGGHGGGYGYRRFTYRQKLAAILLGEAPLTALDKLYERVRDVQDQVKTYSEQVEAMSASLSIQEKRLKELVLVILEELKKTDMRQNETINKLEENLSELTQDNVTLYDHVHNLNVLNDANADLQEEAENLWTKERAVDVGQERQIHTLYTVISDLKEKLFQVKENTFAVFYDTVERDTTLLDSIKKREARRLCEVGQVTLDAVDLRVEYQYQNWFEKVPQIIWGLSGFTFNTDTREDPAHFGYGYPPKEPEAIGVHVNAYSTKTGISLEGFDLSFGDTSLVTVDVAFQACTIGPGTDPVDH